MNFKSKICVILILIGVILISYGYADDQFSIAEYQKKQLEKLWDEGYITTKLSVEDCLETIDIPIQENLLSSAVVGEYIYILSETGLYQIDKNRDMRVYSFIEEGKTGYEIKQIFEFENELYAVLAFNDDFGLESEIVLRYAKIDIRDNGICVGEGIKIKMGFYKGGQKGTLVGEQLFAFSNNGYIYCKDYPSDSNISSLLEFNIENGYGREIAQIPGCYDMIAVGDTIFSLHESIHHLAQIYYIPTDSGLWESTAKVLLITEISSGKQVIIDMLDGIYGTLAGQAAGLAFDEENNDLYYCSNGKLHRVSDLDFEADTIIADALGNFLQITSCRTKSYLIDNSFYVSIIPCVGVDYIAIEK